MILDEGTSTFTPINETTKDAHEILYKVYHALKIKGYDPVTQLVGYILSGDPTYITSYAQARSMICRIERDDILEELVKHYIVGLNNDIK